MDYSKSNSQPFQMSIFTHPDINPSGYSQGLELFTCIPWFEMSKNNLNVSGTADPARLRQERSAMIYNTRVKLIVFAAPLENCHRFPGVREEIILDALLKIAGSGHNGSMTNNSASVSFSLKEIFKTVKSLNGNKAKYDLGAIKESLLVLNGARYELQVFDESGDSTMYRDSLLSGLGVSSRREWLSGNHSDSPCYARFHPLVFIAIEALRIRPYRLDVTMQFSSPYARRMHKYLSMYYKQCSTAHPYNISLSHALEMTTNVNSDSKSTLSKKARPFESALIELGEQDVLADWSYTSSYEKGKTGRDKEMDRIYKLVPHASFVKSVRKSNALQNIIRDKQDIATVNQA